MRIPKLCLHKASGRAVVRINCKDYYCGEYGTEAADAQYRRLIGQWKASGFQLSFMSSPTVAMISADYLDYCRAQYPPSKYNEADQVRNALRYLEPYWDDLAEDFGPLKLKAVRQSILEATGRFGKPLSRKYINGIVSRIIRAFRWAAENELIGINIVQALANVRPLTREGVESQRVHPVSDEVIALTLPKLGPVVAAMVQYQRLCGCRPIEVCTLTPALIDRSRDVWVACYQSHKTAHRGKSRQVYIGPRAQKILQPYLFLDPCFGYTTDSYRQAIHRACDRAFPAPKNMTDNQVKQWQLDHRWSPNQLRHAVGTAIRKEFGIEAAQVLLGHTHLDTTQIYAERNVAEGLRIAAQFG